MVVRCTQCNAAYAVEDKKIENRKFGFSCPRCGTSVVIDNRQPSVEGRPTAVVAPRRDAKLTAATSETASKKGGAAPLTEDVELPTGEELAMIIEAGEDKEPFREAGRGVSGREFDAGEIDATRDEPLAMDDFGKGLEEIEKAGDFKPLEDELDLDTIIVDDGLSGHEPRAAAKRPLPAHPGGKYETREDLVLDKGIKEDEIFSKGSADMDESITIDLDSLDIELEEAEGKRGEAVSGLEELEEMAEFEEKPQPRAHRAVAGLEEEEDLSTTIDLDTLDITLDEQEELKKGVSVDDDERLTLSDTGLTIDELGAEVADQPAAEVFIEDGLDEDIKLNLKEIDPLLSVDDLSRGVESAEKLAIDDFADGKLPEIDMDRFKSEEAIEEGFEEAIGAKEAGPSEDFLDIETRDELAKYRDELEKETADVVPGGAINFSIDYSLSYSRLGGLLRLSGLFLIGLVPHVLVFLVYFVLSSLVGFLNWLVAAFTGYTEEDFTEVQEKTLRYMISLSASASGVVEDMPAYAGRKDIGYPLQLNVIYPVRYSKLLAVLRLSVAGMVIMMLPHLLLFTLLSLGAGLVSLVGVLSVVISKKWPTALFDFMVRYYGYASALFAFMAGIIDKYPSFRFE